MMQRRKNRQKSKRVSCSGKMLRNAEVIDEEDGAKDTISLGTTVTVLDGI